MTGREFILKYEGNSHFNTLSDKDYVELVKSRFPKSKQYILLSKEIPTGFTSSQLNNSRHIARKAMELLSHIVREKGEVESRSKHVLPVTGRVTSELKKAWRLDQTWKELVAPRFKRLNELTQSELFGKEQLNKEGHSYFDCNLHGSVREMNPNFDIKRIDHRHHALDALIIALCTEEHVNLINNNNTGIDPKKKNNYKKIAQIENYRTTLKQKLQYYTKEEKKDDKYWHFLPPLAYIEKGKNNHQDNMMKFDFIFKDEKSKIYNNVILSALEDIVVTFKKKKSPIRKTSNKYLSYYDEKGNLRTNNIGKPVKKITKQIDINCKEFESDKQRNIAIRREMHDETPYGQTILDFEILEISKNLNNRQLIIDNEIKVKLEDIIANCNDDLKQASEQLKKEPLLDENDHPIEKTAFKLPVKKTFSKIRKVLSDITNEKQLQKIADWRLQKELLQHIAKYNNDYKEAFSPMGIDDFNSNRKIPVKKVTWIEGGSSKYILGKKEFKRHHNKLVKGTNYCFVIDRKENDYYTISLKQIIDNYYKGIDINKEMENETKNKFFLSAGDLVYVPNEEELKHSNTFSIEDIDKNRIYKFTDSSNKIANFVPMSVSSVLWKFHQDKAKKEIYKILKDLHLITIIEKDLIKDEFGLGSQQSKNQNSIDGIQIKSICWKLEVDRLGNIINIIK